MLSVFSNWLLFCGRPARTSYWKPLDYVPDAVEQKGDKWISFDTWNVHSAPGRVELLLFVNLNSHPIISLRALYYYFSKVFDCLFCSCISPNLTFSPVPLSHFSLRLWVYCEFLYLQSSKFLSDISLSVVASSLLSASTCVSLRVCLSIQWYYDR